MKKWPPERHLGLKVQVWLRTCKESQSLYAPVNTKQCLPIHVNGVWGTKNRLNNFGLATYHRLPTGILPILSHKDGLLVERLWQMAHIQRDETGSVHLTKALTMVRLKSGFFGAHITNISKIATAMIRNCTECKRHSIKLNLVKISDKWPLRMSGMEKGLWSMVGLDLIGPYLFMAGKVTRSNKILKCWILVMVDQLTSAVHFCYMEDYSTDSFIQAFANHGNYFRFPSLITADQGSQIKSGARRINRSMIVKEEDKDFAIQSETEGASWEKMLAATMKRFKQTRFFLAPTEAQSQNGCAEGNNFVWIYFY